MTIPTQTIPEERYIHCTIHQCTDASRVEGSKGIICPLDLRYHQFRQKCIYNITSEDVAKRAQTTSDSLLDRHTQGSSKCTDQKIIDLQPVIAARKKTDRAKQYEEISHLADHLYPKE